MDIGKKLLQIRKSKGLTQAELARGICNRSMISQIETSILNPSLALLQQLASRLGVHLNELIVDSDILVPNDFFGQISTELDNLQSLKRYQEVLSFVSFVTRQSERLLGDYELAYLYRHVGLAYYYLQDFSSSESYFTKAMSYPIVDNELRIQIMNGLASTYVRQEKYVDAKFIYLKAIKLSKNDVRKQTRLIFNLANLYLRTNDFSLCLQQISDAMKLGNNHGYLERFGDLLALQGLCYAHLNQYNQSLESYESAMYFHLFRGEYDLAAGVCVNIGHMHLKADPTNVELIKQNAIRCEEYLRKKPNPAIHMEYIELLSKLIN